MDILQLKDALFVVEFNATRELSNFVQSNTIIPDLLCSAQKDFPLLFQNKSMFYPISFVWKEFTSLFFLFPFTLGLLGL